MKKSDNPLLSEIQDVIKEKFDLESWPMNATDGGPSNNYSYVDGDWIDVYVFNDKPYVFTIGINESKIIIYRPGKDSWGLDNTIDLFAKDFLEQLLDQIDELMSSMNLKELE